MQAVYRIRAKAGNEDSKVLFETPDLQKALWHFSWNTADTLIKEGEQEEAVGYADILRESDDSDAILVWVNSRGECGIDIGITDPDYQAVSERWGEP